MVFLLIGLGVILQSCARIYTSPDAGRVAGRHQVVAIIPPTVTIAPRKKVDPDAIRDLQKSESLNFQKEMYSWMLRRKMQERISVDVMDVETINAALRKAGYFDGEAMSPAEICALLNVDGIILSNYSLAKPMSEGAAVALGLLTGIWGSTNQVNITMDIFDGAGRKMIWNYNHIASGSAFTNANQLVDNLMRHASKKMPYVQS